MFNKIDWVFLRRPLIIFAILVSSSVVFYWGGLLYEESNDKLFTSAKNSLSSTHSKLNKTSKEIALVDDYLQAFKTLENNAFIGDERRLSWIESIKETNKTIKLPTFKYSIKAQSAFERVGLKQTKRVKAYASSMDLNLGLLHEEDLFKVFKLLDNNVQSHFIIDACSISKGRNRELSVKKENLKARCIVNWVHLKVAKK